MPLALRVSDFKLFRAVCEIRYAPAPLVFDRTGRVLQEMRGKFTDLRIDGAAPTQTTARAEEGGFSLQIGQCHFVVDDPEPRLERFAHNCRQYFDIVLRSMEIKVFSRIGLRVLLRKEFPTKAESQGALRSLDLFNRKPANHFFGSSTDPRELLVRWEGAEGGATLRFKVESVELEAVIPSEFNTENSVLRKSLHYLLLDVDYYTIAPVEREQWDAEAWIPESIRAIRKGADLILEERVR